MTTQPAEKTAPLRVLMLEDDPDDAVLLRRALEAAGIPIDGLRVDNEAAFRAGLQKFRPELIVSDYSVPGFGGAGALKIAQELAPDTPFIYVSGTIGEERAIEALHNGATDYIIKDRMARLGPAVRRALGEARERTEKRRLEDDLRQAQKMEAIGRLSAGVAHDFNNLLTVVLGYSELLLSRLDEGDPRRSDAEEIRRAVSRATAITRQLLYFTRKQVLQTRALDLNGVVRGMEKLLRRILGEDIELAVEPAASLAAVRADESQLEQILLNLAVNARDAMPQGGKLLIRTRQVPGAAAAGRSWVQLEVLDTGCGMDEGTQAQVFEPFFTTKEVGTGLGLSTVRAIVRKFGGEIALASAPGSGTTFTLRFPASPEEAEPSSESLPQPASLDGTETIMVVEDDAAIRALARRSLAARGYTVIEAGRPEEALRWLENGGGKLDLLVVDAVLPAISGAKVAASFQGRVPALKVLFLSGHTEESLKAQGLKDGSSTFLQKPYSPQSLLKKVREVLGAPVNGPAAAG